MGEQVLAVQAHALLRRIARIRDALVVPVPIVLSLDCNADATSLAYRALLQGQLDFEEAPPAPPSKDESGKKQDAYEKFNRRADKLFEELEQCQLIPRPARTDRRSYSKDGDFHQNLPLKSAYAEVLGKEEPFSVYTEMISGCAITCSPPESSLLPCSLEYMNTSSASTRECRALVFRLRICR